jgi:acetoin utilization deacetylase AcuC-like enzyme
MSATELLRGAGNWVEGPRRGSPKDFADFAQASDVTIVIPAVKRSAAEWILVSAGFDPHKDLVVQDRFWFRLDDERIERAVRTFARGVRVDLE